MASMATMPSSAAQLMFLPFFNGSPLTPMPSIGSNGLNRNDTNGIEKYSSISPNQNQMYSKISSHSSPLLHSRESKASDSENQHNSVTTSPEEDNYGGNTPLNLTKPKPRGNCGLSSSIPLDIISRMSHESALNSTQPLTSQESAQMAMFGDNSYWNPLSIPAHLKKNPFNAMAIHASGLDLMPPMDSINMYLANTSVPSMIIPESMKKESTGFHSNADNSERKTDSVITCQSMASNVSILSTIY